MKKLFKRLLHPKKSAKAAANSNDDLNVVIDSSCDVVGDGNSKKSSDEPIRSSSIQIEWVFF